jgi:signal transduction histidine kinase
LGSDWGEPIDLYFKDKAFKENFGHIIGRYINLGNYNFIESLSDNADSQVSLLTREKEIQLERLKEEIRIRNMGIAILIITLSSLIFIILLYRRSQRLLKKIEQQSKNIELQNQELDLKNQKLEEFTFANAHKLRAPVASILGLIQLFSYRDVHDNENIIALLKTSANDLDREVKAIRLKLEEEGWIKPEDSVQHEHKSSGT